MKQINKEKPSNIFVLVPASIREVSCCFKLTGQNKGEKQ